MKKIVYIFAATLMTASVASAAAPRKFAVSQAQSNHAENVASRTLEVSKCDMSHVIKSTPDLSSFGKAKLSTQSSNVTSRAGSGVSALYSPSAGSFYFGLTPGYGYWGYYGLTGIKNLIGFANMSTGADSYEWSYGTAVDSENNEYVYDYSEASTDKHLMMKLEPLEVYSAPILNVSANGETDSYKSTVEGYYTGESPVEWGFGYPDETGAVEYAKLPGLSIYNQPLTRLTGIDFFSTSKTDTENYDQNGVCLDWAEFFESTESISFANWKIKGFSTVVPAKPSSYLLSDIYFAPNMTSTEDVTLTCNVYFLPSEEGEDIIGPVAKGEVTIPAGTFPAGEEDNMPLFELYALDADGYETDMPLSVPALTDLYVTIEGVDNPAITDFLIAVFKGYEMPVRQFDYNVIGTMTPTHAYALMDVDVKRAGESEYTTMEIDAPCPFPFYGDQTMTTLWYPTDFAIFFNVYFPIVANIDKDSEDYGTGYFTVETPADGGKAEVKFVSSFPIAGLLEEGLMTAKSNDWIKFETVEVNGETGAYTQVNIETEALPEGQKGRQGVILFEGYGSDFYILVNQGEVAGISNIAAANGPAEYFDLQGRKLNSVPSNGLYLERQGNKTVKRIAR